MNRRRYFQMAGATLTFSLGGCASVLEDGISKLVGGPRSLGESVSHRGVEVTPDLYTTSTSVTYDLADGNNELNESAPDGATFLLTHLAVRHVGENKRVFPSRGTFGGTKGDRIKHFYKGERLSRGRHEDVSKTFLVGEYRFPNYIRILLDKDLSGVVYSGEVSGWLINEIPEGFSPSDATIEVTWGSSSTTKDEGVETYEWQLTEEASRSPENASDSADSDNTTIEL